MEPQQIQEPPAQLANKQKLNLSIDLRLIVALLLVVIIAMFAMWRPWSASTDANARTIKVTGEATLTDTPDEYVFYPSYDFKNADKDAALKELNAKSTAVVAGLKKLGVTDKQIKTDSSGYDYQLYTTANGEVTYTLRFTVTIQDKGLAQKVQDYLVSTSPMGSVSPQADFSDAKRKQLQTKARNEATDDARAKADQMAKSLGFTVGKVKSVSEGQQFSILPYAVSGAAEATDTVGKSSLTVQPGQNDLDYSLEVTYYIR